MNDATEPIRREMVKEFNENALTFQHSPRFYFDFSS